MAADSGLPLRAVIFRAAPLPAVASRVAFAAVTNYGSTMRSSLVVIAQKGRCLRDDKSNRRIHRRECGVCDR